MHIARTADLDRSLLERIKHMSEAAFGHPFVEDWDHALGGSHFIVVEDGLPVSHASVVERVLETGGSILRTGYVEAVATLPDRQRQGHGSRILRAVTDHIRSTFDLGGLTTGAHRLYERFGWETWRGPTFVRIGERVERTAHEDGGVMILRTPSSPPLDLDAAISCDWRPGDVW